MPTLPAATPSEISGLALCSAVFLPGDPPRTGRIAFWHPAGAGPPAGPGGDDALSDLTVAAAGAHGGARTHVVRARLLPVRDALPVLTRVRVSEDASPATGFWGAAAVLALQLAARGLLLPGLTATDHDAWRVGPLSAEDLDRIRTLAAAMPPTAHAVPLDATAEPLLLPGPERLLRAFLDAVADGLPRTPAAPLAAGSGAFAADEPRVLPEARAWAQDVAAGLDAGVRLSLRVEVLGLTGGAADTPSFRAVLQMHSVGDPALVADTATVWAAGQDAAFGPRARMDALLALRRAARAWAPLTPLLSAAVPDAVELADEEVTELLGEASRALAATGVEVHWPRELTTRLTARAVIGPRTSRPTGLRPDPRPGRQVRTHRPRTRQAPGCPRSCPRTPCSPSTGGSHWATSD